MGNPGIPTPPVTLEVIVVMKVLVVLLIDVKVEMIDDVREVVEVVTVETTVDVEVVAVVVNNPPPISNIAERSDVCNGSKSRLEPMAQPLPGDVM